MQYKTRFVIASSVVLVATLAGFALAFGSNFGTKLEPQDVLLGDTQGYDLDKLHSYRTPYVNENSNAAAIAQLLPTPDSNMRYDRISLQTDREPIGLTIYCKRQTTRCIEKEKPMVHEDPQALCYVQCC